MITGSPTEVLLPLTRAEANALLSLARKGRVLLDVDKAFLRHPDQRAAGRRAVDRLRLTLEATAPCRVDPQGGAQRQTAQPSDHGAKERAPA